MIKFVSYDGHWPSYCCGILKVELNGKTYVCEKHALISGGAIVYKDGFDEPVLAEGPWRIDVNKLPAELKPYADEVAKVVNDAVEPGCCGGCI